MNRWKRSLAPGLLAFSLLAGMPPSPATAQPPDPRAAPAEEETGNPVPGYLMTSVLGFLIIFLVCRSARR
jgi:hypothetical protein